MKSLVHFHNNESSSDEWRAEVDSLDSRDQLGGYFDSYAGVWRLGEYNPSYVDCLPFDSLRTYKARDFAIGNGDENDK